MATKYFVLQSLWSDTAHRELLPGEQAELSELSDAQIEKLTAGNVIMPWVDTASASSGATTSQPPQPETPAIEAPTANDGVQGTPAV